MSRLNYSQESKTVKAGIRSFGPVPGLEQQLQPDWWRRIFNSTCLKTDADVVEDQRITRAELDTFARILNLKPEDKILDLCCGQGRHSLELARQGFQNMEGLDRSRDPIQKAKTPAKREALNVRFREGDARKVPRICGYEAKSLPSSPCWDLRSVPAALPEETEKFVIECCLKLLEILEVRDYCRFDWRLDSEGNPKLLEVNPNPGWCWDGHVAKMAKIAGLSSVEMLKAILEAAEHRLRISEANVLQGGVVHNRTANQRPHLTGILLVLHSG